MKINEIRILIASPSDLLDEREAAFRVITELNTTLARNAGFYLNLLRYEEDAVPGIGEDPQQVVNEYLGQDFDILVGMFWTRIGTPTTRSQSGTVEELENAIEQYLSHPERTRVMLYFKLAAVDPFEVDVDQLKAVQQFRRKLSDGGSRYQALYSKFESTDDFEKQLRIHLTNLLLKWSKSWADTEEESSTVDTGELEAEPTDEDLSGDEGLLDLIEIAEDQLNFGTEALTNITNALKTLGDDMSTRTDEINAESSGTDLNRKRLMRILSNTARDMDVFVERVDTELPIHTEAFSSAITAYNQFLDIFTTDWKLEDREREQLEELKISISDMASSIGGIREPVKNMYGAIDGLPRITREFSRSKRKLLAAIRRMIDVFNQEEVLALALLDTVTDTITVND